MKFFFGFFFAMGIALGSLPAADKFPSAFETLRQAQKQIGELGKYPLRIESEHAKLRPRYWWIRFYDHKVILKMRAINIMGNQILQNIEPLNPFDPGILDYALQSEHLKYDSEKCISFIEKVAKGNRVPLYSLNIRLKKPDTGSSYPSWFFELLDEKDESLGKISISAATGKVTEIVNLQLKDPRSKSKKASLSVGADI